MDINFEEYEKNIIEIFNFLLTDLSESISLKELNTSYPDAANYLFTRFNLDESCNLGIEELTIYINSYTLSKEFLYALEGNVNFILNIFCCSNFHWNRPNIYIFPFGFTLNSS